MMGRDANVVVRKYQMRKSDYQTRMSYGNDNHTIPIDKPLRPD
ncbi:hypothetical protein Pla22_33860 [Rubripirellula amarantea]|uniref:Uncharacterized protein n=1 Tax=Rubripirellula amarantea TaxID=2527999 RepID=A0A5C5WKZ6_9BACT|nr:hypothetical protein Pla22_33860 [Rubripirellula amarantea]